jgi:ketosteroid isomerase-like protein
MSKENVKIIAQGADALTRQDAEAFVATVSPDVEWEDAMFWTEPARVYRGRREVGEWFERAIVEPWESIHVEVEEIIDAGDDRIVAGGLLTGRGRGSGAETQAHGWSVFWIANGMIWRRRIFLDRAEALEAAGLRDG